MNKLDEAHRGVASTDQALHEDQPKLDAKKEKKKKKKATGIEAPAMSFQSGAVPARPATIPSTGYGSSQPSGLYSAGTAYEPSATLGPFNTPDTLPGERPSLRAANQQIALNMGLMVGVCTIEMIVATAASSQVAWIDAYCRLGAVLNMLYDMEMQDREQESQIVEGHVVCRAHVGEIAICHNPESRLQKARELADLKQLQDQRAAYLSVLLVSTYLLTVSFVMTTNATAKL